MTRACQLLIFFAFALVTSVSYADEPKATEEVYPVPLGLPPIPWPKDNPYTKKKAELGRLLYFDKRLSADGTISCASCHSISKAYTDHKPVSRGIKGNLGTRCAPTIINSAYLQSYFWDGRASSLEEQVKGPISNPKEMSESKDAHIALYECHKRIYSIPGYRVLFKEVFGNEDCSIDDIAKAIATFERTILSGNSPYDRYKAGDKQAMTPQAIRGMQVYKDAKCINCHFGFNFSDFRYLNIGVGTEAEQPDTGRYTISKQKSDWCAFKVPTLREVSYTYPYMHDGSQWSLEEVIDYYDKGGRKNQNLNPSVQPLHLSEEDKKALLSFLYSLNGEGWQHFKEPDKFPQ